MRPHPNTTLRILPAFLAAALLASAPVKAAEFAYDGTLTICGGLCIALGGLFGITTGSDLDGVYDNTTGDFAGQVGVGGTSGTLDWDTAAGPWQLNTANAGLTDDGSNITGGFLAIDNVNDAGALATLVVYVSGSGAQDFGVPGGPVAEWVAFVGIPDMMGGANADPTSVVAQGTGTWSLVMTPTPAITVNPTSVDFGSILTGTMPSPTMNVVISNPGTANLLFDPLSITGMDAADFSVSGDCTGSVAAAGMCTATITFAPTVAGLKSANLNIQTNVPLTARGSFGGQLVTVPLSGEGVAPVPDISVDPASFTFASVATGGMDTGSITVTNNGTGPLTISGVGGMDTIDAPFSLVMETCTAAPVAAMGGMCTIDLMFMPTAFGSFMDTFDIASDDPDSGSVLVTLNGSALEPDISVSPTALILTGIDLNSMTLTSAGSITVTNNGMADLNVSAVASTDPLIPPFSVTMETCTTGPVAPMGGTCTIDIEFAPAMVGDFMDSFEIASDDPDSGSIIATVEGSATDSAVPDISVDPTALDFMTVLVGMTSDMMVTVTNNGTADLNVSGVTLPPVGDFSQTNDCTVVASGGGTCTVTVTYAPGNAGTDVASLTITSDDPDSGSTVVSLTGAGELPVAGFMSDPTSLDFGMVVIGTAPDPTLEIAITNTGTGDLTIVSSTITGTDAAEFSVADDCGGTVAPAGSCMATVTFTPADPDGVKSASLDIQTNVPLTSEGLGQTFSIALSGVAAPMPLPMIDIQGNGDLGTVAIGSDATSDLTVTNTGMADLTISGVTVSAGDFSQANGCGVLASQESCTITVTYAPTSVGAATATLTVDSDDPMNPMATYALSGTGEEAADPMISVPMSVSFGSVEIGASGTQTITVMNDGGGDLEITDVSLGGANGGEFTQTNTCGTVTAGATCTIMVTYAPAIEGTKEAMITVTSNDPALAQAIIMLLASAPAQTFIGDFIVEVDSGSGAVGPLEVLGMLLLLALFVNRSRREFSRRLVPVLAALVLLLPLSAHAEDEGPGYADQFVFGVSLGGADARLTEDSLVERFAQQGLTVIPLASEDNDLAWKVYGTWNFSRNFGVEVAYVDMGAIETRIELPGIDVANASSIAQTVANTLPFLGSGFTAAVVGRHRLNERFSAFAKAGTFIWENETDFSATVNGNNVAFDSTQDGSDFMYGVGFDLHFKKNRFGFRAEYELLEPGPEDVQMWSGSLYWRFGN